MKFLRLIRHLATTRWSTRRHFTPQVRGRDRTGHRRVRKRSTPGRSASLSRPPSICRSYGAICRRGSARCSCSDSSACGIRRTTTVS